VADSQIAAVSGHQRGDRDQPLLNGDGVAKTPLGIGPLRQSGVDRAKVAIAQCQVGLVGTLSGMISHQLQLDGEGLFDPALCSARLGANEQRAEVIVTGCEIVQVCFIVRALLAYRFLKLNCVAVVLGGQSIVARLICQQAEIAVGRS
jgi:hypothetical protein